MSKAGRLGLIALALIAVVGAFIIISPGDDDEGSSTPAAATSETSPTATAPSATTPPPDAVAPAEPTRIELTGHAAGEVASIKVRKGERVRFVVTSDEPDDIHVHGYDIELQVAPGKPARFSFPATIEGIFEVESHEAEHHGRDPLIARLVVEPS